MDRAAHRLAELRPPVRIGEQRYRRSSPNLAVLLLVLAACHPQTKETPEAVISTARATASARTSEAQPDTSAPAATSNEPFLRWSFEEKVNPEGLMLCYPRAVAWLDGEDRLLWERDLPGRIRAQAWGACKDAEISEYRREPRHRAQLLYALIGVLVSENAVFIAEGSGILALRRQDGAPLLDHAAPLDDRPLFFDTGSFDLTDGPSCTGAARRGRVFARCGESLVYFNGTTALLIAAATFRVEAESTVTRAMVSSQRISTEAAIPLGTRTLGLHGRTYMR